MTRAEFELVKPKILTILEESLPLEPQNLLAKLTTELSLEEPEARHAIWRLLDDGDIRLSLDRRFELAELPVA